MSQILHKVRRRESVLSICLLYNMTYERFCELNFEWGLLGVRGDDLKVGELVVIGDTEDPFDLLRVELARNNQQKGG